MRFFLRSVFLAILRFVVLLGLLTSLIYLETSPLPENAVYTVLSYLIHFGVTWVFARWVFAHHAPTWLEAGWVFGVFTVFSLLMEFAIQAWITSSDWSAGFGNLNWQSALVLLVQALAVAAAAWSARRSAPNSTPVGLVR